MKKTGFTLIELLIVIVIMGILFGLLTIAIGFARDNAKKARRTADVRTITAAIQAYRHEYGRWPVNEAIAWATTNLNLSFTDHAEIKLYMTTYADGFNDRNITFMNFGQYKQDSDGNLIDPWLRRYEINIRLSDDLVSISP